MATKRPYRGGDEAMGRLVCADGPSGRFVAYCNPHGVSTRIASQKDAEQLLCDGRITDDNFRECYGGQDDRDAM